MESWLLLGIFAAGYLAGEAVQLLSQLKRERRERRLFEELEQEYGLSRCRVDH
jgi:hypothetical protein